MRFMNGDPARRPQNGARARPDLEAGPPVRGRVPHTLRMRKPAPSSKARPVRARILWPALGFPAVIAPRQGSRQTATMNVDATRCITVLLLTDRPTLSKEEAARYLRIVPWAQKGRRHIPAGGAGSFREIDLVVRNDTAGPKLALPQPAGADQQLIGFGGGAGAHAFIANLSIRVRKFYADAKLRYLHEIRVSEEKSATFADGLYHVFWNNEKPGENAPSDELALLLERHAGPTRRGENSMWRKVLRHHLLEYEFEYGDLHPPYAPSVSDRPMRRTEILHPVRIQRAPAGELRIGHITDLHVDVRMDVYEHNLKVKKPASDPAFNNWNRSVSEIYAHAKGDSDILLLTGDLIDYGRGHVGIAGANRLGDDRYYHQDRNWFLFYDLLAAGDRYSVPVYTSLGNHDWRLNPYPPFAAAGAPGADTMIHDHARFSPAQLRSLMELAHGPGHEPAFSYHPNWRSLDLAQIVQNARALVKGVVKLDRPGLPTATDIRSVIWYLLTINPFLDYFATLPGGYRLLMLDWAEDEAVLFPTVKLGKEFTIRLSRADLREAAMPGPKAIRCLTSSQQWLVRQLVEAPGRGKILGIHAPPLGPYPDWVEDELIRGFKSYASRSAARGPMDFGVKRAGQVTVRNGHPMFAVAPRNAPAGMVADYGSLMNQRDWLIRTLAQPSSGVRLVLSGHIHRNGLHVVRVPGAAEGALLNGQYLMQSIVPMTTPCDLRTGTIEPAGAVVGRKGSRAPLYVNTTSAGLRGNHYPTTTPGRTNANPGYSHIVFTAAGVIRSVAFRCPVQVRRLSALPRPTRAPAPAQPPVPAPARTQPTPARLPDRKIPVTF